MAAEGRLSRAAGGDLLPAGPCGTQGREAAAGGAGQVHLPVLRGAGECLDYAIRIHEPHGIWGGLNEMERKQMSDRRAG